MDLAGYAAAGVSTCFGVYEESSSSSSIKSKSSSSVCDLTKLGDRHTCYYFTTNAGYTHLEISHQSPSRGRGHVEGMCGSGCSSGSGISI